MAPTAPNSKQFPKSNSPTTINSILHPKRRTTTRLFYTPKTTIGFTITRTHSYATRTQGYTARIHGYATRTQGYTARIHSYATITHGYTARTHGYATRTHSYATRTHGYTARTCSYVTITHGSTARTRGYALNAASVPACVPLMQQASTLASSCTPLASSTLARLCAFARNKKTLMQQALVADPVEAPRLRPLNAASVHACDFLCRSPTLATFVFHHITKLFNHPSSKSQQFYYFYRDFLFEMFDQPK